MAGRIKARQLTYLRFMEDAFFLPVTYRNQELQFEATLERRGFIHVISVDVDGTKVDFERDDEGTWRALLNQPDTGKPPPVELLRAIGQTIEEVLK
jgi:hypothetical protein